MTYRFRVAAPALPVLRSELSRAFDDVFVQPARRAWQPVQINEAPEGYTLSLDVPGVAPEQIEVTVEGRTLRIAGERQGARFVRHFTLPEGIDPSQITATAAHGVLTVTVAKPEAAKPHRITVQVGQGDVAAA